MIGMSWDIATVLRVPPKRRRPSHGLPMFIIAWVGTILSAMSTMVKTTHQLLFSGFKPVMGHLCPLTRIVGPAFSNRNLDTLYWAVPNWASIHPPWTEDVKPSRRSVSLARRDNIFIVLIAILHRPRLGAVFAP